MKRAGALGSIALILVLLSGMSAAGAAVANPAVTTGTLTIKTEVHNAGHGLATPDSFVYHVTDNNTATDVADGVFNASGTTSVKLPPGSYGISEDSIVPYVEHVSNCGNVTVSLGHTSKCTVSNVWTPSTITVSLTIDNAGGGTAKPSDFHYKVIDTSDNSVAQQGTFGASGTTNVNLVNSGTYTVTEDQAAGYTEDDSQCADLSIDYLDPQVCQIANTFDPHSTTTQSNTSTTAPSDKQSTIHGSVTNTSVCIETLQPQLQADSNANIAFTLSSDAFPNPHEGDPIKLTNTTVAITTPGSLIQTGLNLGIIAAGDKIPENVTFVLGGSSTTQGTHTYHFSETLTIAAKNGKAEPLVVTATLPDTTWNPVNSTDPVFFAEKSLVLVSKITSPALGGSVTSTFTCTTPDAPNVLALSAQPGVPPTSVPGGGGTGTGGPGGVGGSASGTTSGILPVTGTSVWLWLAPAVLFLSLGLLGISGTARKRRRVLNR